MPKAIFFAPCTTSTAAGRNDDWVKYDEKEWSTLERGFAEELAF